MELSTIEVCQETEKINRYEMEIILYGRKGNKWTKEAELILNKNRWDYQFEMAKSCNGRDSNTQYVRIIPTVRLLLDEGAFINIEGIENIKKWFSRENEDGLLIELLKGT